MESHFPAPGHQEHVRGPGEQLELQQALLWREAGHFRPHLQSLLQVQETEHQLGACTRYTILTVQGARHILLWAELFPTRPVRMIRTSWVRSAKGKLSGKWPERKCQLDTAGLKAETWSVGLKGAAGLHALKPPTRELQSCCPAAFTAREALPEPSRR